MNALKRKIYDILDRARADICANMDAQGITASGRTKESLQVEEYEGGVRLVQRSEVGGAPIQTTEVGRRPGKVPANFTDIIVQWSIDKGLQFQTDRERRKFAGAVAWGKIRQDGYGRPSSSAWGNKSATIYSPVVESVADEIKSAIFASVKEIIKTN